MSLATVTEDGKPWVRYVTGWGLEDLTIQFVTSLSSRKVGHIRHNPEVHLICGAKDAESLVTHLQISGRAQFTTAEEVRQRYWSDELKAHFSVPDDPTYCVGVVKPYRIEYYSLAEMRPELWEAN